MDLASLLVLVESHAWLAIAVLCVGYLVRLTGKDSRFPLDIPEQWQPVLVLGLGVLADVLQEVSAGKSWKAAVNPALVIAVIVLALKAYYRGREPAWLRWVALVAPKPPTTAVAVALSPGEATVTVKGDVQPLLDVAADATKAVHDSKPPAPPKDPTS